MRKLMLSALLILPVLILFINWRSSPYSAYQDKYKVVKSQTQIDEWVDNETAKLQEQITAEVDQLASEKSIPIKDSAATLYSPLDP